MSAYKDPEYKSKHALLPRSRYTQQKSHARSRGIGFELTFEQWWSIWQESEKWVQRGKAVGCFCMARNGDVGAYEIGNVAIVEVGANLKDQMNNGAHASHKLSATEVSEAFGWADSFSQNRIARFLGVSQGHVSKLLSGKRGKMI